MDRTGRRELVGMAVAGIVLSTVMGLAAVATRSDAPGGVATAPREGTSWNPLSGARPAPAAATAPVTATSRATSSPAPVTTVPAMPKTSPAKPASMSASTPAPAALPAPHRTSGNSSQTSTSSGLPIVYTTPGPDGSCGLGGLPGVQYICSGTYAPLPPIPSNSTCTGTATQCLNMLDPGLPNDIPGLMGGG